MSATRGLVDPSTFHPTSAQLKGGAMAADGLVRQAGQRLGDLGERVADRAAAIDSRWAGLAGCYQAPESQRVLGLVAPAAVAAQEVRGALVGVKVSLEMYADALWAVAVKLAALEGEAQAFATSEEVVHGVADTSPEAWTAANGVWAAGHGDLRGGMTSLDRLASSTVPWWQDQAMVAKNDAFWARLYQCQQDIEQAAWVCSTMICQVAAPQAAAGAFTSGVDTTEQIAAFDAAQGWGRPRDRGLLPGEQAWTDLNEAALAPVAALAFGWDTTSRDGYARTWGNGADAEQARNQVRSQTWAGMSEMVAAFAVGAFARDPTTRQMLDDRYGQGWTDQRRQIVSDTALSLIAYDPTRPEDPWHTYRDAPYGAATTLAVNAAGLVAGPKALGALGKTAAGSRAGLTAARTAESLPTRAAHAAETATDGRAAAAAALDRAARTDPPPITHHPNLPKVSDTIRKPGDTTQGPKSWLYQEPPHEAPPVQRPHTQTGEPAPPGAEHTRTPASRPSGSTDAHSTAPGRAADAVTTQHLTGLPRPSRADTDLPPTHAAPDVLSHRPGVIERGGPDGADGPRVSREQMGDPRHWAPDEVVENKGRPKWTIGKDDPVPQDLVEHAAARQSVIADAGQARANFGASFEALNIELDRAGLPRMEASDFRSDQLTRTERRARMALADHPDAMDSFRDAAKAARDRRAALLAERETGEAFGEAAGREIAAREGYTPVVADGAPGSGSVDQAWLSQDGSELVLQECKGPSARLITREVPLPDGTTITAKQGSTAYTWEIIRADQRLRYAILADPSLHRGLLDGSVTVRYRLIQPDAIGHVRVTELIIDQSRLDVQGWLGGPP